MDSYKLRTLLSALKLKDLKELLKKTDLHTKINMTQKKADLCNDIIAHCDEKNKKKSLKTKNLKKIKGGAMNDDGRIEYILNAIDIHNVIETKADQLMELNHNYSQQQALIIAKSQIIQLIKDYLPDMDNGDIIGKLVEDIIMFPDQA